MVEIAVMNGDVEVGRLNLVANFPSRLSTDCAWQGIIVSGCWHAESTANACRAGLYF